MSDETSTAPDPTAPDPASPTATRGADPLRNTDAVLDRQARRRAGPPSFAPVVTGPAPVPAAGQPAPAEAGGPAGPATATTTTATTTSATTTTSAPDAPPTPSDTAAGDGGPPPESTAPARRRSTRRTGAAPAPAEAPPTLGTARGNRRQIHLNLTPECATALEAATGPTTSKGDVVLAALAAHHRDAAPPAGPDEGGDPFTRPATRRRRLSVPGAQRTEFMVSPEQASEIAAVAERAQITATVLVERCLRMHLGLPADGGG